jgi:hypothetical protein
MRFTLSPYGLAGGGFRAVDLGTFYARPVARGKALTQVMRACMRKLAVLLNTPAARGQVSGQSHAILFLLRVAAPRRLVRCSVPTPRDRAFRPE